MGGPLRISRLEFLALCLIDNIDPREWGPLWRIVDRLDTHWLTKNREERGAKEVGGDRAGKASPGHRSGTG